MAEFRMPSLGADMETGRLVEWFVKPGDRVKRGDVVAVVETHKGAIDVEIFLDGVIDALAPLQAELPVGAVLAQVRVDGEAAPAPTTPAPAPPPPPPPPSPVAASRAAAAAAPVAVSPGGSRRAISPAARARARELGIDVQGLAGTGVDGAVTLADVERAPAAPPAPRVPRGFDPAQMRAAIATAMTRSKREIPHYYLHETVPMRAALDWLHATNAALPVTQRLLPAVLLIKAVARALAAAPQLNGHFVDRSFRPAAEVQVGVAISLRGGGLVAPALHDVAHKPLAQVMAELADLVQRARNGGLRSSEMSDATITVTNLGDQGVESVFGVIYPPQVALVGFGRVAERPWIDGGQVVAMPVVGASLAADHRVSDGHVGALFLAALAEQLQHPEEL
jgi:pyruvate dehydrogenase E2 component (dihydrolipoamide acetyltransferase)